MLVDSAFGKKGHKNSNIYINNIDIWFLDHKYEKKIVKCNKSNSNINYKANIMFYIIEILLKYNNY